MVIYLSDECTKKLTTLLIDLSLYSKHKVVRLLAESMCTKENLFKHEMPANLLGKSIRYTHPHTHTRSAVQIRTIRIDDIVYKIYQGNTNMLDLLLILAL